MQKSFSVVVVVSIIVVVFCCFGCIKQCEALNSLLRQPLPRIPVLDVSLNMFGMSYNEQHLTVSNGKVYLAGAFQNTSMTFQTTSGTTTLYKDPSSVQAGWVGQLSTTLDKFAWVTRITCSSTSCNVNVYTMCPLPSGGGVYVVGITSGNTNFGDTTSISVALASIFVAKISEAGVWGLIHRANRNDVTDYAFACAAGSDNSIHVGGSLKQKLVLTADESYLLNGDSAQPFQAWIANFSGSSAITTGRTLINYGSTADTTILRSIVLSGSYVIAATHLIDRNIARIIFFNKNYVVNKIYEFTST